MRPSPGLPEVILLRNEVSLEPPLSLSKIFSDFFCDPRLPSLPSLPFLLCLHSCHPSISAWMLSLPASPPPCLILHRQYPKSLTHPILPRCLLQMSSSWKTQTDTNCTQVTRCGLGSLSSWQVRPHLEWNVRQRKFLHKEAAQLPWFHEWWLRKMSRWRGMSLLVWWLRHFKDIGLKKPTRTAQLTVYYWIKLRLYRRTKTNWRQLANN